MVKKKNHSENDLVNSYYSCVLFKRYYQYNLWFGSFGEYNNLKYCKKYIQKYLYYCIFFLLLERFSLSFVIFLYRSPCFIKFVESGFFKYLDYHFLLSFYNNCFTSNLKSKQKIKAFVKLYFNFFFKKRFEKDLLILVNKAISEILLNFLKKRLINRLKDIQISAGRVWLNDKILFKLTVNKNSYYNSCFIDLNKVYIIKVPYFFIPLEIICKSLLKFRGNKVLKSTKVSKQIMEKTFIEFPRKNLHRSNKDIQYLVECIESSVGLNSQQKKIGLHKSASVLFVDSFIQNYSLFKKSFKNYSLLKKSLTFFFIKYKCKRKFYTKF